MSVPDGYYLGKVQFAGKYIFEEGTNRKVSMNYHEFNFPKVKLGANYYELINHKGYFIPKNKPSHMPPSGVTREEFEILQVMAEYHGISPPAESIIEKDTPQQILRDAFEEDSDDDDDGWNDYRIK